LIHSCFNAHAPDAAMISQIVATAATMMMTGILHFHGMDGPHHTLCSGRALRAGSAEGQREAQDQRGNQASHRHHGGEKRRTSTRYEHGSPFCIRKASPGAIDTRIALRRGEKTWQFHQPEQVLPLWQGSLNMIREASR